MLESIDTIAKVWPVLLTLVGLVAMVVDLRSDVRTQRKENDENKKEIAAMKIEFEMSKVDLARLIGQSQTTFQKAVDKMTESNHQVEIKIAELSVKFEHMNNNIKQLQIIKDYTQGRE